MKRIEDIEKLTLQELEAISDDTSIKVPEDLSKSLSELLGAAELMEEPVKPQRPLLRWAIAAAVAAALGLGIYFSIPKSPRDTFSDPYLAYAEVQQAFEFISQKSNKAAEIAGKAVPVMEKTEEIIRNLNK
ncbi:MAG: hypothetical protein GX899_06520 [Rikenellaceae bacterium]|nr:hypothetical protein [Rikenellaceae bacterium]